LPGSVVPVGVDVGLLAETPVGEALLLVVVVVVVSELLLSEVSEDDSRKSFVRSIGLEPVIFLGRDFFREMGSVIRLPKSAFRILSILNFRLA